MNALDDLPAPDPPLTDGVVRLREVEERDAEAFSRAAHGTDVAARAYGRDRDFGPEATLEYLRRLREGRERGTGIGLTVEDCADGSFAGHTLVFNFQPRDRVAEIGFWTAPWARGRGVAIRAVLLATSWAFEELGMERAHGLTEPDNEPARRVLERAGYRHEGVLRGLGLGPDGRIDYASYGRLSTDAAPALHP